MAEVPEVVITVVKAEAVDIQGKVVFFKIDPGLLAVEAADKNLKVFKDKLLELGAKEVFFISNEVELVTEKSKEA
jgi:hypothetical protein